MSHSQTVKMLLNNQSAFEATAQELGAKAFSTEVSEVRLYDGTYRGMFIHLSNWKYPIVASDGELRYDSFNGHWGNEGDINRLRQTYAANVVRLTASNDGKPLVSDTREGNNRVLHLLNQDGSQTKATVSETGDTLLEVVGCSGSACRSHTAPISSALGVVTSDIYAPEFYERERLKEREME
jgi:hypothetical protein